MSLSITRIEYNLDRTEPVDISEKISFWLLKPERILNGRKYHVVESHFERLPAQSTLFKIITFVLSCCFFLLTLTAYFAGSFLLERSKSYRECVNKHINFIKNNYKHEGWKDSTEDEFKLYTMAGELRLQDLQREDLELKKMKRELDTDLHAEKQKTLTLIADSQITLSNKIDYLSQAIHTIQTSLNQGAQVQAALQVP